MMSVCSVRLFRKMISFVLAVFALLSCSDVQQPKPRGYFRIDFPEKEYVSLDTMTYFSFEIPNYSEITPDYFSPQEKNWINVEFRPFKSTLHLSYKTINNNLDTLLNDAYTLVTKHIAKASGIRDSVVVHSDKNVYGLVYFLDGEGVASPLQFYVTDSVSHFLRGSLYYNITANYDSLQPVTDFIMTDVRHLINTVEWK